MIDIVFNTTDYEAIHLSVFNWSHNAIKCYEQMGFEIRPESETSMHVDGLNWKAHNMILLNSKHNGYQINN